MWDAACGGTAPDGCGPPRGEAAARQLYELQFRVSEQPKVPKFIARLAGKLRPARFKEPQFVAKGNVIKLRRGKPYRFPTDCQRRAIRTFHMI